VKHSNFVYDELAYGHIKIFDESNNEYITPKTRVSPKHKYVIEHCKFNSTELSDAFSKFSWVGGLQ
jgi:hypothetical protein